MSSPTTALSRIRAVALGSVIAASLTGGTLIAAPAVWADDAAGSPVDDVRAQSEDAGASGDDEPVPDVPGADTDADAEAPSAEPGSTPAPTRPAVPAPQPSPDTTTPAQPDPEQSEAPAQPEPTPTPSAPTPDSPTPGSPTPGSPTPGSPTPDPSATPEPPATAEPTPAPDPSSPAAPEPDEPELPWGSAGTSGSDVLDGRGSTDGARRGDSGVRTADPTPTSADGVEVDGGATGGDGTARLNATVGPTSATGRTDAQPVGSLAGQVTPDLTRPVVWVPWAGALGIAVLAGAALLLGPVVRRRR